MCPSYSGTQLVCVSVIVGHTVSVCYCYSGTQLVCVTITVTY